MNTPANRPSPLTDGQRSALLTLLQDDDPAVANLARRRLLDEGPELSPWLRQHVLSNDARLRRRTREILLHFEAVEADAEMMGFCQQAGEDLDLEEGSLRLARSQFPGINADAYRAILDQWAAQVSEWLPEDRSDDDGILAALQVGLFQQIGLHGNEANYYEPDNSYLTRTIDRRLGNPLSLCTVVLLVGRRLALPLAGIGLPAHFLCRYQSANRQVYVDAFNGGRLLTRTDCVTFVNQLGRPFDDGYLQPVSTRRMLQRVCTNLEHAFEGLERRGDMGRIQRYHHLLASG